MKTEPKTISEDNLYPTVEVGNSLYSVECNREEGGFTPGYGSYILKPFRGLATANLITRQDDPDYRNRYKLYRRGKGNDSLMPFELVERKGLKPRFVALPRPKSQP